MTISLRENPKFLVKLFGSLSILGALCLVCVGICFCIDYVGMSECFPVLIFFIVYNVVFVSLTLALKFYRGTKFIFSDEKIEIHKKHSVEIINIQDVEGILFIRFKFRYIITIYAGALNAGGCWKLHVKMKNGEKKELAFFDKKDVILLKEKLYGELITII